MYIIYEFLIASPQHSNYAYFLSTVATSVIPFFEVKPCIHNFLLLASFPSRSIKSRLHVIWAAFFWLAHITLLDSFLGTVIGIFVTLSYSRNCPMFPSLFIPNSSSVWFDSPLFRFYFFSLGCLKLCIGGPSEKWR